MNSFQVEGECKSRLVSMISAWVAVSKLFGGTAIDCRAMQEDLEKLTVPELKMMVQTLYCEACVNTSN